jgi:hypothetical protein
MGEIAYVDPERLRALTARFETAGDRVAALELPLLDPDELRGSAVGAAVSPESVTARLRDVVTRLHGWAHAALTSADAFEQADVVNGERIAAG